MQFTKTLAATAALLTVAGAAAAADVTLYGIVDEGLLYKHTRTNGVSSNSFSMESGLFAPSRWGMKGNEELGNGLKVGFKLESGFSSDTGALANEGKRLFHRESALTVSGGFGTLAAGRMGGVGSNSGTYDIVYAMSEVSDGSWANVLGMFMSDRYDNMLTYQSPKFAGLQATVQYSFKGNDADDKNVEGTSKVDRYYSGALSYENGGLQAVVAYEYFNRGNDKEQDVDSRSIRRNAQIVSLGGSYDFGVAKVFGLAQYADGVNRFGFFGESDLRNAFGIEKEKEKTTLMNYDGFKGWAAHLGASIPVCGGLLRTGLYYADGKAEKVKVNDADKAGSDLRFYGVNAQYNYPLSKRTEVYTGLGYGSSKLDASADSGKYKSEETTVYVGMTHRF
jgi:predicted porin